MSKVIGHILLLAALVALGAAIVWWWQWLSLLWFVVGIGIGMAIFFMDQQFGRGWYQPFEGVPLTRSSLFVVVFLPLAVFILTSSGNVIGPGVTLGILSALGLGVIQHSGSREQLAEWLPLSARLPQILLEWWPLLAVVLVWLGVGLTVVGWR